MQSVLRRPTVLFVICGIAVALLVIGALIPNVAFGTASAKYAHAANRHTTQTIVPSTTKVHPNQTITVSGRGFTAHETVYLYIDNTTGNWAGSIPCNSSGVCSGPMTFSQSPGLQGRHMLIAKGLPGETANAHITILPAIFFATNMGGYTQGGPGSVVVLSGESFQANETVSIYWGKGNSTSLGTATTDAYYGYFNATLHLPTGVAPGVYSIHVITAGSTPMTLTTSFRIIPPSLTAQASVQSGQILTFSFTGFQGLETINVSWNANGGQQIGTIQARGDGSGQSQNMLVTPSAPRGKYTLTLTGQSSRLQSSTTITVGPGIDLSAGYMVSPGAQLTVQGGGFTSNEQVRVQIVGDSSPSGNATVTTGTNGGFQVTLIAPESQVPNQQYTVTATNTSGTDVATSSFYISFASITFSDTQQGNNVAVYGTPATISGTGFAVNELVSLYWNYQQPTQVALGTARAASDGTFSFNITVPSAPFTSGNNLPVIEAIGASSTFQASTQVTIASAIYANPARGTAGQVVQVTGGMLPANTSIALAFDTTSNVIENVTTASDGSFSTPFTVPANASIGLHTIYATENGSYLYTAYVIPVTVSLTPSSGSSNTSITVQVPNLWSSCNFFSPQAEIVWFDSVSGSGQNLQSVTCNHSGTLNTTINAPTGLVAGRIYEVQVFENGSMVGQAAFTAQ